MVAWLDDGLAASLVIYQAVSMVAEMDFWSVALTV
jgi:hypothetical protein